MVEKCPNCGSVEVEANTPRTTYKCGSSDYDQRPGTFKQSGECTNKLLSQAGVSAKKAGIALRNTLNSLKS